MKTIIISLSLIIIGTGVFIWWEHSRWMRYVSEYKCIKTGKTRELRIPVWVTTGNNGGFINWIPLTDYEYKCLNGRIWH